MQWMVSDGVARPAKFVSALGEIDSRLSFRSEEAHKVQKHQRLQSRRCLINICDRFEDSAVYADGKCEMLSSALSVMRHVGGEAV